MQDMNFTSLKQLLKKGKNIKLIFQRLKETQGLSQQILLPQMNMDLVSASFLLG